MSDELVLPTVIRTLDLDAVRQRLMAKKGWTAAHADHMVEEYREYLALFYFHPGEELVPPSRDLDDVWHEHILDTQTYAEDCRRIFGRFVHHVPGLEDGTERHTEGLERTRRHWWNVFGRKREHKLTFQKNDSGGFETVVYDGGSCSSYMPPAESHAGFFDSFFSGGHSGGAGGGADFGQDGGHSADSGGGDSVGDSGGDSGGGGDGGGCGGGGGD